MTGDTWKLIGGIIFSSDFFVWVKLEGNNISMLITNCNGKRCQTFFWLTFICNRMAIKISIQNNSLNKHNLFC